MRAVLRSIAAVVVGFVVASVVLVIVEFISGHWLYPELAQSAVGVTDPEQFRALLAAAPVPSLLIILVGWTLGALAGGWTAARLAGKAKVGHALVVGILLVAASVMNNLMLPPPTWFWIASLVALLPAAWLGGASVSARAHT